jgi:type III pantothenate kinase
MKLVVDMGNTQIKWGLLESGKLTETDSFKRNKTSIKASLNKAWKTLSDIDEVLVSNVSGDKFAEQLSQWTQDNWALTPQFIGSEAKRFGVSNAYEEPEKLGVDRWLALIVARQHARQATCIIDCGTAITVDIITQEGDHQGGMIFPGLTLMQESLSGNTDGLKNIDGEQQFDTLATNTFSAIQSGSLYMVSATLERLIDDLKHQFNDRIRFLISGGDAETLMPLLGEQVTHYPDIVLRGLSYYARQNDKSKRSKNRKKDTVETDVESSETQPETLSEDAN